MDEIVNILVQEDNDPIYILPIDTIDVVSINVISKQYPLEPIITHDVNAIVVGNGEINSNPSTLTNLKKGSLVSVNATPYTNNRFVNWLINGVSYTNRLASFYISAATTVQAVFEYLGGIINILKTFTQPPKNRGNKYYFGDYSGNDNDVECKGSRVGTFTSSSYINTGLYLQGKSEFNFECEYIPNNIAVNKNIFYTKNTGSSQAGVLIWILDFKLYVTISNGTGSVQTTGFGGIQSGVSNKIKVNWNGLSGGLITVELNGVVNSITALYEWVGNSYTQILLGYQSFSCQGGLAAAKLNGYFDYVINHGQGSTIYDISGNGNNGVVTGAVLSTFWGSTSDEVIPYDVTLGATLYKVPYVNYLSGELILNGTFDTNVDSWVGNNANNVRTWENGRMRVVNLVDWAFSQQLHPEWISGTYVKFEFDVLENISTAPIGIGLGSSIAEGQLIVRSVGHYFGYATIGATKAFQIRPYGVGTMNILIDNITVKKINDIPAGVEGSIMPICYNKPEDIPGYTRLGYFPPGSGILKGLPNKYNLVGNSEVPAGDYTADEIAAFTPSPLVEVEQTAYAVTQLKLNQ